MRKYILGKELDILKGIQPIIEGLLFLAGDEGLSFSKLCEVMDNVEPTMLEEALQAIKREYEEHKGLQLVCYGGAYKFVTRESVFPYAQKLFASIKTSTLSNAAMETLAIIAYKQPITRTEIEELRGVSSDMMIRKLLARNLIREKGRSDAIGRPILYEVTDVFMDAFQLESLKELPDLPAFASEKESLFDEA